MDSSGIFVAPAVNLINLRLRMMETIVSMFIEHGAIIFGGYVRDLIIRQHFISIFKSNGNPMDKFWDPSFDPKTVNRLLVPNDIDIVVYCQCLPVLFERLAKGVSPLCPTMHLQFPTNIWRKESIAWSSSILRILRCSSVKTSPALSTSVLSIATPSHLLKIPT